MKKIHFAFACLLLFLISCNTDTKTVATTDAAASTTEKTSMLAQKNLDVMHAVNKGFETGDVSGLDSMIADNFVDHTDKGEVKGKDSLKAGIKMAHASDSTMKMEIIKELADDDYVFAFMHYTGTGDGKMMPAGHYDMHSVEVVKFSNGKATEHWEFNETSEMMKMMQNMMPPQKDKMKMMKKK